jgi:hypothetical protein
MHARSKGWSWSWLQPEATGQASVPSIWKAQGTCLDVWIDVGSVTNICPEADRPATPAAPQPPHLVRTQQHLALCLAYSSAVCTQSPHSSIPSASLSISPHLTSIPSYPVAAPQQPTGCTQSLHISTPAAYRMHIIPAHQHLSST